MDAASYAAELDQQNDTSMQANPFTRIVFGRPALGTFGDTYPYREDIATAAERLSEDASLAAEKSSALVYMGHGNKNFATSGVYQEFAEEMNRQYPETFTVMTTLEGGASLDDTIKQLRERNIEQVVLKPFMVVAGKHTRDDMLGVKPESLKNRLEDAGFAIRPVIRGLGEQNGFADIFVQHIQDAASDAAIHLE